MTPLARKSRRALLPRAETSFWQSTGEYFYPKGRHGLEQSTTRGYAAALRRLRKGSREQFGASPRQVLELEIKETVASENAEGNLKTLLSACRPLDKLRLHPSIAETGDWQVVKWLAK